MSKGFEWDGFYTLSDGRLTDKRSQGAYDAQKRGSFPFSEAVSYISRALKVNPEEAKKLLERHPDQSHEWHHVGPEGDEAGYFRARELAVWKKLEAIDPKWATTIWMAGLKESHNGGKYPEGEVNEMKRFAEKTGLKLEKILDAYRHAPSDMKLEAVMNKLTDDKKS